MFILSGFGKNAKRIGNAGIEKCPNCNNWTPMGIYEISKQVTVFFIPVAKWKNECYIICPICSGGYPLTDGKRDVILQLSIGRPDDKTAGEIWNELDAIFVTKLEKLDVEVENDFVALLTDFAEEANRKLENKYLKEHLESVLSSYLQKMADKFGVNLTQ